MIRGVRYTLITSSDRTSD